MMQYASSSHQRLLLSLCGSVFLFILLGPTIAKSATYYVSLSGSDANIGTSTSSPFRTFAKSTRTLRPGDTLYIRGGVWTEQLDLMANNTSGTSGNYIKIAGYPGETVTLRYADSATGGYGPVKARGARGYLIFENLILDGINDTNNTGWQFPDGNHHFILRNLEIKNFKFNGLFIGANDIQVINCTIHNQISASGQVGERWYGIYFHHGSNGLLQGNKIYSNPGGGIHAYPGPSSNLVIRGNAVYNNNALASSTVGGILVWGTPSSIISAPQIYNNLVYRNGTSASGTASGIEVGYYVQNAKIWNNTVYGNKSYGLRIGHNTTAVNSVVQNNISYSNGAGNYVSLGSNTTYTNNLTTDPQFVSSSSSNFQLQSTSPAINKGVVLGSVPTDYKNTPRPRGASYDIGGYEY